MTDQLIIEPEARLIVELGQERGVVYEDELAGLSLELDLDEPYPISDLNRPIG